MMNYIFFVSKNINKYNELKSMFDIPHMELEFYKIDHEELQTEDMDKLIKQKAFSAYEKLRRPVLVEHTILKIKAFGDLPGSQTNHFYSQFGCQDIVDFCRYKGEFRAHTESLLCFCDGKQYVIGRGGEDGYIVKEIRSKIKGFAWDKIYVPSENNESELTYAEKGIDKLNTSMRRKAWEDLKRQIWDKLSNCFSEEKRIDELAELIKQRKVMLFIGAGISASLGLPSWNKLIKELGEQEGFEGELLACHGDNMLLAEYIGRNGNDSVYEVMKKKLTIEGEPNIKEKLKNSQLYKHILELNCPVIYTTNYDHIIEEYFQITGHKFSKIVKISDLNHIAENTTRIVKFHGDIDDKESIVLTESQYFERMDFKSFLDIQLQADMLKYHVLFLGYSLSDINIKLLMYLMRKQWSSEKPKKAYIFTATPNRVQQAVFEKNSIMAFSGNCADKEQGTLEFLKQLQERVCVS